MKNFIQNGIVISITAPAGGVTSGDGVLVGALFGIATTTAAAGESVEISTRGVFELPKTTATIVTVGAPVSWDDTDKRCDAPGVGRCPIGIVTEAAGNAVSSVRVRLNGIGTAAAA